MADGTKIEWTDATWNPIIGCSVVSPGCTNCYAMRLAGTRLAHLPSRVGLTHDTKAGPVWNGKVRFNEQWLDQPLRWRKPRMVFVCAHGDLFHESIPDAWIDRVFAVMALAPQHVFQVLTKRPERMREYCTDPNTTHRIAKAMDTITASASYLREEGHQWAVEAPIQWPLPNCWKGVSVEDQPRADERIPLLLDTPAAVRWISAEPMLGPIDLTSILSPEYWGENADGWRFSALSSGDEYHLMNDAGPNLHSDGPYRDCRLDWIVAGAESGPGARPCDLAWIRSLRDQCAAAGVPFFWKQHVENGRKISLPMLDGVTHDAFPEVTR